MQLWKNWSGSLTFTPQTIVSPHSENELCEIVSKANSSGKSIRVVGAGHSSSPLVETNEILISLDRFSGLTSIDKKNNRAEVGTAMTVHDVNSSLQEAGFA